MSTVKITDLPVISSLDANTGNTILVGVDLSSDVTGRLSATVLADGLYENKALKVGLPDIIFPNVIAQFAGSGDPYLQINAQNTDANNSIDYVATADIGTNANNFIDMGINNSLYDDPDFSAQKALDGYLYVHGSVDSSSDGNLIIGTASAGANVVFAVGGQRSANVVATISRFGLSMNGASYIKFADGSIQSTAPTPLSFIQDAYNTANSASANTIISQGVNITQNTRLNSIETVNVDQNTSISIIQGVDVTQNTRLNSIETVNNNQNTSISIIEGVNLAQNASISIIEGVNLTQNTRLDSIEAVNTNQNTSISIIEGVNLTQNTNITTANNHAWAAFDKANNALANTTGTFGGNLTISGNTFVTGYFNIVNPNFQANSALIDITASDGGVTVPPSNSYYMMHITGKSNNVTRVVFDSFGANTYPLLSGRMGRGSAASPAAAANNDVLMRIVGNGHTGTQFPSSSPAKIDFVAAENFSDTNRGTRIEFWNTAVGSNTLQEIASFNANAAEFLGTINPQKGFIYTPTIYQGAQTAITIDFSTTSLIKAELTNDLTFTLTNYVYGKVVEVWLTNTGGTQRTITHGCSALNSTINSTTFNMSATSSAYLRYFSIDGDNANTFVAIQHA